MFSPSLDYSQRELALLSVPPCSQIRVHGDIFSTIYYDDIKNPRVIFPLRNATQCRRISDSREEYQRAPSYPSKVLGSPKLA